MSNFDQTYHGGQDYIARNVWGNHPCAATLHGRAGTRLPEVELCYIAASKQLSGEVISVAIFQGAWAALMMNFLSMQRRGCLS